MSYTTRRTARANPQVNYHQTPTNPQRQSGRVAAQQQNPNSGYNAATTPAAGNFNQASFPAQQGYSSVRTDQSPPPTPQQAKQPPLPPTPAATKAPAASKTAVIAKAPAAPQPPLPSTPVAVVASQPKAVPVEPKQPPLPPTPKTEVAEPVVKVDNEEETAVVATENAAETNGEGRKRKPHWAYNRGGPYKINKKLRRRRQNARLRKLLMPKNALMILHELHPEMKCAIQEQLNALHQTVFSTIVTVEDKQYHGQAMSKTGSKLVACENALKSILLDKMGKAARTPAVGGGDVMDQTEPKVEEPEEKAAEAGENGDGDGEEEMESAESRPLRSRLDDDVPWRSLASFAMHKLFVEWQNQGIQVPSFTFSHSLGGGVLPPIAGSHNYSLQLPQPLMAQRALPPQSLASSDSTVAGVSPRPMKKLPDDPNKCHPVQLLNQLRPGSLYTEQCSGTANSISYTVSVKIDSQDFVGVARNKREAKRQCAKAALVNMGIIQDSD